MPRESYVGQRDPRRCLVCRHPDVIEIDVALAQGHSIHGLAKKYGLNRPPLDRHKKKGHVMATAKGEVWDMAQPRDQLMVTSKRLTELLGAVQQRLNTDKDLDMGTVRVFTGLLREQRAHIDAIRKAVDQRPARQTTAQIIAAVMGAIADATINAPNVREDIATMFVARGLIEPATGTELQGPHGMPAGDNDGPPPEVVSPPTQHNTGSSS